MAGSLDAHEVKASLRGLGLTAHKADVARLFESAQKEPTDLITFEEYVAMLTPVLPDPDSREEIMKLFKLYDVDNTGKISAKNLRKIAQEIGESITEDELIAMLKEGDKDRDGLIGPDDFYRIIKRTHAQYLDDWTD